MSSSSAPWAITCSSCKTVVADGYTFPTCGHSSCFICCSRSLTTKGASECKTCNAKEIPIHSIETKNVQQQILKILIYCGSENYNNHCRAGISLTAAKYGMDYPPVLIDLITSSKEVTANAATLFPQYNCILVSSCAGAFHDAAESGNIIAEYSNTITRRGNGVVLVHFTQTDSGSLSLSGTALKGTFHNSKLHPLAYSTHTRARFTLTERQLPSHPLLKHVDSFVTGDNSPVSSCKASSGSTVVATYQDNVPVIAFKQNPVSGNTLVGLNMYCMANKPLGDECCWQADTNGYEIMVNALVFASGYSANKSKFNDKLASYQRTKVYSDVVLLFKE